MRTLKDDIRIDENALDVELLNQASLLKKYCDIEADLKYEVGKKEIKLDSIKATLDAQMRADPEKFGLTKGTDTVINNAIPGHKDYVKVRKEVLQARLEWNSAQGAVKAIEQRKSMLEKLVQLYSSSYFAGPSVPRDLSKERNSFEQQKTEKTKSVNKRIKEKLKRD